MLDINFAASIELHRHWEAEEKTFQPEGWSKVRSGEAAMVNFFLIHHTGSLRSLT